jgi:hypothetical protein
MSNLPPHQLRLYLSSQRNYSIEDKINTLFDQVIHSVIEKTITNETCEEDLEYITNYYIGLRNQILSEIGYERQNINSDMINLPNLSNKKDNVPNKDDIPKWNNEPEEDNIIEKE